MDIFAVLISVNHHYLWK